MIVHRVPQYSPEWWAVRKGLPTGSCAEKLLTPTGKPSTQGYAYINELIACKMGFADEPMEPTEWMVRGIELEPQARQFYELLTGETVEQVGFITNDDVTAGCSPDGLIGEKGWEVKCPKASTHIGYLLGAKLPDFYKPQVHFSMAVTGLKEWVFMSYYPGLDPLIVTVQWDAYTDQMAEAINVFVGHLDTAWKRIRKAA